MAFAACFTCTFATQGKIVADNTKPNHPVMKDQVEIQAWSMKCIAPYDIATGHTSGKRQWSPLTITKVQGPADALLWQALVRNETVKTLVLTIFRSTTKASPGGGLGAAAGKSAEVPYYILTLTNAQVVNVETATSFATVEGGSSAKHSSALDTEELTKVAFSFQKVEGSFPQFSKNHDDDWTI